MIVQLKVKWRDGRSEVIEREAKNTADAVMRALAEAVERGEEVPRVMSAQPVTKEVQRV